MTLFVIKNKQVLTMRSLELFVLRFIYEPEKMTPDEVRLMEQSIQSWSTKLCHGCMRDLINCECLSINAQLEDLQMIGKLLKMNADGDLDERKAMFKRHNIDWRKYHNVPGAHTPESLWKAKMMLEDYQKKNPELA